MCKILLTVTQICILCNRLADRNSLAKILVEGISSPVLNCSAMLGTEHVFSLNNDNIETESTQ